MQLSYLAGTIIQVYIYLVIARAIGSWFVKDWSRGVPRFLWDVTEPALGLARRIILPISGIDFSPWIVIIALSLLSSMLTGSVFGL